MAKGLGRGEGFAWTWDLSARLPEEVDPGAVLPLQAMDANLVIRNPGTPDAPVCGPHQSDDDPNLDVSARTRVGLLSLCCDATGYPFQGSRHLHTHQTVNGGNEGRGVSELLEACSSKFENNVKILKVWFYQLVN